MAAYAAVTSLLGTIHLISQSCLKLQEGHKEHLRLLYKKVRSLQELLDNSDDEPTKDLQEKVKDLAQEVEDKVESRIQREAQKTLLKMLQRVFNLPTKAHWRLLKIMQQAIKDIDSVKERLIKQRENNNLPAEIFHLVLPVQHNIMFQPSKMIWWGTTLNKSSWGINLGVTRLNWKSSPLLAFDQKVCLIGFEDVAKEVVEHCKGLPLLISVVAGTLSSKRTLDEWRKVAQSVSSLVNLDDYQRCSGVLSLSYNHLPSHLKGCFLYFGVFPKASEISVKKLIRLWVAEGFIELKGLEGLEKVAANLLHDLIDKSLVVVSKQSLAGKIKTCRIHDLLHDLCLREAESENLLYVANPVTYEGSRRVSSQGRRWVSVHPKRGCFSFISFDDLIHSITRSLHISSNITEWRLKLELDHFILLRVLDLETLSFGYFPSEILHLVSLRTQWDHIFIKWIWMMSQLRHLHSTRMYLYSPPKVSANDVKYCFLENLQSVSGMSPRCCTKKTFEGIKKVKELGIGGNTSDFYKKPKCLDNLIYLHELEALRIASYNSEPDGLFLRLPCPGSFPPNLKKLTLCRTFLPWEDMAILSKLPKLEVLQLKAHAFVGSEIVGETVWEVTEIGFLELKFLFLEKLHLDYWRVTDDYFPCLERIIIKNCSSLQEIPKGFADSMTLQLIELHQCSPSLVNSAELIRKEQLESLGNNMLKVYAFDKIRERNSDEDSGDSTEEVMEETDEDSEED
ncbi:putative late blight resistance protein -like r1a-6 [Nicotiana attenuata]|uniref:Late blight resistance protein -like r1a-6 n=1 Tax=Nicotiana attenuata TaxID=49451 RepID=A0A1J6IGV5_NICAT|nr:putative late blight resistance protein -like r1a-6 [Nicotiana attenuata]